MVNFYTPGLEGLYDLDRRGVDIRPTLLRVLTDQYLRNAEHTPGETARYTELATRLLHEVDITTRASVSALLAPHASAPRSIILELARDVLDVAEPVLLHSPILTPADCEAIVAEGGPFYAEIVARRGGRATEVQAAATVPAALDALPEVVASPPAVPALPAAAPAPAATKQAITARATLAPPAKPPVAATTAPKTTASMTAAAAPAKPAVTPSPKIDPNRIENSVKRAREAAPSPRPVGQVAADLCEMFYEAGGAERRLILLNLEYAPWPAEPLPATLMRADIWRIETAALRHNSLTVIRELERLLGLTYQQSRRMVEDDSGEPIVVAAKAMGLPADVLQRILLFMNPRVGLSIDRVYECAALYSEISVAAARRLVAIIRTAGQTEAKVQQTQTLQSAVETTRRAISQSTATPARTFEPGRLRLAVG